MYSLEGSDRQVQNLPPLPPTSEAEAARSSSSGAFGLDSDKPDLKTSRCLRIAEDMQTSSCIATNGEIEEIGSALEIPDLSLSSFALATDNGRPSLTFSSELLNLRRVSEA